MFEKQCKRQRVNKEANELICKSMKGGLKLGRYDGAIRE